MEFRRCLVEEWNLGWTHYFFVLDSVFVGDGNVDILFLTDGVVIDNGKVNILFIMNVGVVGDDNISI